jgi:Rieske Fe-S protein
MKISKRTFLKATGTAAVCTCFGGSLCSVSAAVRQVSDTPIAPGGSFRVESDKVFLNLKKVETLAKVGGSVKLAINDDAQPAVKTKIIVVRSGEKKYQVFSDACTHGGMELEYQHAKQILRCVSFGKSEFDMHGTVLRGPAKAPLTVYPVLLSDHELVIQLGGFVSRKK